MIVSGHTDMYIYIYMCDSERSYIHIYVIVSGHTDIYIYDSDRSYRHIYM